ncbi:MAG: hypothetical protein AMJ53_05115 [Gammaproteobacteria bacterium SG8_11]|nr:MAG: hypothetical protein AMJ53_05115 [Gammaproteobacteria bacterium SG8_11]
MSPIVLQILALGIISFLVAILLMHLGRHQDANIWSFFRIRFSYSALEKHVKHQFIRPIIVFAYIAIYSIWFAIFALVIFD